MNEEANKEVTPAVEPVISPENITEEQIRAMAAEADGIPYKASPKADTEPEVAAQDSQDASKTTPEAKEESKDSDESAPKAEEKAEVKTEERKASDDSEAKETKAEDSKKETKRAKEEARLSESWKKLEAEKAQVRARQAELEKKIEELEAKNDPTSPSPDALRKYAREWENEGRDDLAKAARQQAEMLEQRAKSQAEKEERQKREFTEQWGSSVRRMIEENPELKDEESPFAKRVVSLLKSEDAELRKLLNTSPNGFAYATQIARMQEAAETSEALRQEVETLRKENTEFRKKTSLSASSTAKAPKRKSFEEMSWQEQEEFLRRNASDADKLGVLIGD